MKSNYFAVMACGLLLATTCDARTDVTRGDISPVHIVQKGIEIRIHEGTNKQVVDGINYLDKPRTLTCRSAKGCVISIQSDAALNGIGFDYTLYSTVDGVEASPPYPEQYSPMLMTVLQRAIVGQGVHTVETVLYFDNEESITASAWQVNYTLYER